jgi:hypothetical protein
MTGVFTVGSGWAGFAAGTAGSSVALAAAVSGAGGFPAVERGSSFEVTGSTCVSSAALSALFAPSPDSGSSKMDRPWSEAMLRHPLSRRTDCVGASLSDALEKTHPGSRATPVGVGRTGV